MRGEPEFFPLPEKVRRKEDIPVEALRQAFGYMARTPVSDVADQILQNVAGDLFWRTPKRVRLNGYVEVDYKPLGERKLFQGKWKVCHLCGLRLYLHHVVWAYHAGEWPGWNVTIKQRNGIHSDTRIENLYRPDKPDLVISPLPEVPNYGSLLEDPPFRREDRHYSASKEDELWQD